MSQKQDKSYWLPKIKEANQADPSMSIKEIASKLGIQQNISTVCRWVGDLKKSKQWKTIDMVETGKQKVQRDDQKVKKSKAKAKAENKAGEVAPKADRTVEQLAEEVKKLGITNKSQVAKKLGISRYMAQKVFKFIAGTSELDVKNDETISTTDNNVISVTPKKGGIDVVAGNWYTFLDHKRQNRQVLVLNVSDRGVVSSVQCGYDIESVWASPTLQCSITTFKKRTKLRLDKTYTDALYLVERILSRFPKFSFTKGVSLQKSIEKFDPKVTVYDLMKGSRDQFSKTNESKREAVEDTFEDQTNTTAGKEQIVAEEEIKKTSRVDDLVAKLKECPFRVVLSEDSVSMYFGVEAQSVTKTGDPDKYEKCLKAVDNKDWAELERLCKERKVAAKERSIMFQERGFTVKGGEVVFGDSGSLGRISLKGLDIIMNRADSYIQKGDDRGLDKIANFIEKLTMNPDPVIMSRIVDFIKFKDVEITDDGDLIVYKVVRSDYMDKYTGKVDNSIGSRVFMRRMLVDSNERNECSHGLHVCALSYVGSFHSGNARIVSCLLNPEHIVSIPADYNGAKIRACEYKVLEDVTAAYVSRKLRVDTKGEFAQ